MRSSREFFQKIVPAVAEHLPRPFPTASLEKPATPETVMPLVNRLISPETRQEFDEQIEQLPQGRTFTRDVVGDPADGTRHVHDFIVDKSDAEAILYYIDPEHTLGKSTNKSLLPRKGDLRPNVSVLYATRFRKGDPVPDISIIRYRTKQITDQKLMKPEAQFKVAQEMLRTGTVPEMLTGLENEITFRLNIRKDSVAVSRNATPDNLERFTRGEVSTSATDGLEGMAHSYAVIMRRYFPQYLREGRLKPLDAGTYP